MEIITMKIIIIRYPVCIVYTKGPRPVGESVEL